MTSEKILDKTIEDEKDITWVPKPMKEQTMSKRWWGGELPDV